MYEQKIKPYIERKIDNMNQILVTGTSNKSKGGPLQLKTVGIIFAVAILILGAVIAGMAIFSQAGGNEAQKQASIPLLEVTQNGAAVTLNITHDSAIDKIMYNWNDEEEVVLQGRGRNIIEEVISATTGTNMLNIRVVDIFGKEATYSKEIIVESSDVTKPQIELIVEDMKIKISVRDETELAYVEFHWNDEDETVLEPREDSKQVIEERIDIIKGENTLRVKAVDTAGNVEEKEQKYKGSTKPTVQMVKEGGNVKISVTHEQNIQKIEYIINGLLYTTDPENTGVALGVTEYTYSFPLATGENEITVRAYNTDNVYNEVTQKITY